MKALKLLLLSVGLVCLLAAPADAAFKLSMDDPGTATPAVVVADGDADGLITHIGGFDGWTFNVQVALSKPGVGSVTEPRLVLTITLVGTGVMELLVTDTGFAPSPTATGLRLQYGLVTPLSTVGSVTMSGEIDPANAEFGMPGTHFVGPVSVGGGPISGTAVGPGFAPLGAPVSMTMKVVVDHTSITGVTTGNVDLDMVPEPAACMIWSALIGLGVALRFRRRKAA